MPRVVGGELAGRSLLGPTGRGTRPTLDRVREALFNIITPRLAGAAVLDLYSGTGALAIEALSRGARLAILVEPDPRARSVIHRNLGQLGLQDATDVWASTAERALPRLPAGRFDLVFCDPPWEEGLSDRVAIGLHRLLTRNGLVVIEGSGDREGVPPADLIRVDRRRYGRTRLDFYAEPAVDR